MDKQHKNEERMEGQNPTLNAPGSKVADYGNPTGGSAAEGETEANTPSDTADRSKIEPLRGDDVAPSNP